MCVLELVYSDVLGLVSTHTVAREMSCPLRLLACWDPASDAPLFVSAEGAALLISVFCWHIQLL